MREKKFDKIAYNREYNKKKYVRMTIQFSAENADFLRKMADSFGLSQPKLIIAALKYISENNIDLSESDAEEL